MDSVCLGSSDLDVSRVGLGTMTFGEQVDERTAHAICDRAVERGVNFIDTAEMYSVPARRETFGATERILGSWFARRPGLRDRVVLATKVAGPSRGMDWVRGGSGDLCAQDIADACDASLARLRTDRIDLYQIHWPNRNAPAFGALYFDPLRDRPQSSVHEQLYALGRLVRAGKVRHVGLSNETPYGLSEFLRVAEQHGLPRVVSVQNPYSLVNRVVDNGLDEMMYRHGVSLIAYSPLAFGLLSGKYDASGFEVEGASAPAGRMVLFDSMRKQRWGRAEVLAAAREYNALAKFHGLTPARMALAFCFGNWRVASTLMGVTSVQQLDEGLDAWGTKLPADLLQQIDAIRWRLRDPAQ